MIKLSVIIVNYNVKYFLEQLLHSLERACNDISSEIFVVDNASSDESVKMLKSKFPDVICIENKENLGFSKANNQAIRLAKGEYVLLLNPDTVVSEDTFKKSIAFMDDHPDAGCLGVKMLDGKGRYLPESKRGLPTPWVSFCKLSGLTTLFPKSKLFAKYYLGHLDENKNHEIEVLAGAYMFMRKTALDKTGLLDEDFFMYGEDIDLSYRFLKAGFKNFYLAETSIIHYKGESTKRGSLNYVKVFYQAMDIYAKKHFTVAGARFYHAIIRIAIYFKAFFELSKRIAGGIFLPLFDALLIFFGMFFLIDFWSKNVKEAEAYYPNLYLEAIIPAYILVWVLSIFFSGGYDKPLKIYKLVRGGIIGTIIISSIYAFLDESLRYSRALIILGGVWTIAVTVFSRIFFKIISHKRLKIDFNNQKKILIAGNLNEGKRVLSLLSQFGVEKNFSGFVVPDENLKNGDNEQIVGSYSQLESISGLLNIEEIIFCSADMPYNHIISWMESMGQEVDFKIVSPGNQSIVGSNSKNAAGDLYAVDINLSITQPSQKRNKRLMDTFLALFLLVFSPIVLLFLKEKSALWKNLFLIIGGKLSFVGYIKETDSTTSNLPNIKSGVLSPADTYQALNLDKVNIKRLNLLYARDYKVYNDIEIIRKGFSKIGRKTA
ncbi:MAG: glycosyltransferase [Chitinophagaceae bacterium]|nr:MAG: glycosyltransferase [Chitinophagaceae bacterium]